MGRISKNEQLACCLSLTPRFSGVLGEPRMNNRFSGFGFWTAWLTPLKRGVNKMTMKTAVFTTRGLSNLEMRPLKCRFVFDSGIFFLFANNWRDGLQFVARLKINQFDTLCIAPNN